MNNKEFIAEVSRRSNQTLGNTQKMALSVFDQLLAQVEDTGSASVPAFGTFEVKKRMERILVNPNSGKRMMVPPKLLLAFKPTNALKELVQKGGEE